MFAGTITALATPMRDGEVDLRSLKQLVDVQLDSGIEGLVPCGTTGEAATLSLEERAQVIRATVQQAAGRVPVIAGVGANDTRVAIANSKMAADAGADALLHVTPYYNKPSPAGQLAHFRAVAEATKLPIVLYNVPGRTGCDMLPDVIAQLAELPNVVAVKEATGSIVRAQQVIAACPAEFAVLSGDDATAMALVAVGGRGVISVVSNVAPAKMSAMIRATREGRHEEARVLLYQLLPLMDLMFIESNPIPVKAALAIQGYGDNDVRLPLAPLPADKAERIKDALQQLGALP